MLYVSGGGLFGCIIQAFGLVNNVQSFLDTKIASGAIGIQQKSTWHEMCSCLKTEHFDVFLKNELSQFWQFDLNVERVQINFKAQNSLATTFLLGNRPSNNKGGG